MTLEVLPATAERWEDLRAVLQPRKSAHTCWCMAWRLTTGDYGRMTADERGEHLRSLVEVADPPPASSATSTGRWPAGATSPLASTWTA